MPMPHAGLRQMLHGLADAFDQVAIAADGHYVTSSTVDDSSAYVHRE